MDCQVKPANDILRAFARKAATEMERRHCEERKRRSNPFVVIPGWCASTRPQMRNCASGNLEIPGSMLRIAPE
jgi:hypothetical protein